MKFNTNFLIEMVGEGVHREIIDKSRWSVTYEEIFEHEGKYYRTYYDVGATEMQDQQPYEWEPEEIECPEVRLVKKMVEVWEEVELSSS